MKCNDCEYFELGDYREALLGKCMCFMYLRDDPMHISFLAFADWTQCKHFKGKWPVPQHCPSCGRIAVTKIDRLNGEYQITCPICYVSGPKGVGQDQAIENWNKMRFEDEVSVSNSVRSCCSNCGNDQQKSKENTKQKKDE